VSPTPWRVGRRSTHFAQVLDANGDALGWLYTGDGYGGNVEAVLRAVNSIRESEGGETDEGDGPLLRVDRPACA
jgi:hypothetical protein